MTMHLLRKASASNTFGMYEIRKLRGTFPLVILVEQAKRESPEPTKLTTRFCTQSSRSSPAMGTVLHTWPNGRFVQIQDGFRSKEMPGPIKRDQFP